MSPVRSLDRLAVQLQLGGHRPMTLASHVHRRIVDDTVHPRAERQVRVESGKVAVGLQKRLLDHIFRFLPPDETGCV